MTRAQSNRNLCLGLGLIACVFFGMFVAFPSAFQSHDASAPIPAAEVQKYQRALDSIERTLDEIERWCRAHPTATECR